MWDFIAIFFLFHSEDFMISKNNLPETSLSGPGNPRTHEAEAGDSRMTSRPTWST